MKPVFQNRFGADGNCWPACLASMLECTLEEADVCSCQEHPAWIERTEKFLAARGLYYVEIKRDADGNFAGTAPPDGALVMLGVGTERNLPHVVIGRVEYDEWHPDGQVAHYQLYIVHDPIKPRGPEGSYDIGSIILLCRLDRP